MKGLTKNGTLDTIRIPVTQFLNACIFFFTLKLQPNAYLDIGIGMSLKLSRQTAAQEFPILEGYFTMTKQRYQTSSHYKKQKK